MRIGKLAEQAGISTKAIRYYEQIGILTLADVRSRDVTLGWEDSAGPKEGSSPLETVGRRVGAAGRGWG